MSDAASDSYKEERREQYARELAVPLQTCFNKINTNQKHFVFTADKSALINIIKESESLQENIKRAHTHRSFRNYGYRMLSFSPEQIVTIHQHYLAESSWGKPQAKEALFYISQFTGTDNSQEFFNWWERANMFHETPRLSALAWLTASSPSYSGSKQSVSKILESRLTVEEVRSFNDFKEGLCISEMQYVITKTGLEQYYPW